jgi:hypothetical protein
MLNSHRQTRMPTSAISAATTAVAAPPDGVQPRAARHGTRATAAMPTRHPETDSRADTEYEHRKTPDNHKHLKSVFGGVSERPRTSVR